MLFGRKKQAAPVEEFEEEISEPEEISVPDIAVKEEPEDDYDIDEEMRAKMEELENNPPPSFAEQNDEAIDINHINPEFFGPLKELALNDKVTDIDYNGRAVWITDETGQRSKTDIDLPLAFVAQFTQKINNSVNAHFSPREPEFEAEAKLFDDDGRMVFLRLTFLSEAIAQTGRTINIRKTPPLPKISIESALKRDEDGFAYCEPDMLSFLINSVKAHMNVIICGEPGTGKTELAKFMSVYIPEWERVVTIEDTLEWHYKEIKPDADCTEIKTNENMNITQAIRFCLRSNPRWMMIAEIRDKEAADFVKGLSTGINGITSLHTDSVTRIPERVVRMTGDKNFEDDVYNFVDVGVLVNRTAVGNGRSKRYVDQIGTFEDVHPGIDGLVDPNQKPTCREIFRMKRRLPDINIQDSIAKKFKRYGITDPYYCQEVADVCKNLGIPF